MDSNEKRAKRDPYNFDNEVGWRAHRVLRPGRGMYYDVKRRMPYYWSDIKDALTYRTFAGTVRIYFVKYATPTVLLPIHRVLASQASDL